ncbi:hypothetical protein UFOVP84_182 [uncultured Caudovirales phage]|uniref:Uncharacterized protein n=1 Tax=uncultured Caudovirales phage TaxID=2100421 RepID=A0A6J5KY04_9CAUD|nr:hypothetical protein UFOVP84_182 [uncultured Caudovirales phage]
MMTRQEQFQEELKALLGRYDAEISVEYNDDDRPIIEFYSQSDSYEDDGSPIGGIEFQCSYFDKDGY